MHDRVGTQFGPYRLDSLIGRGGMGEVYRAYDMVRDRNVALKLLGGSGVDDGTFAERFRRECQLVARLGEPHIIPIHDFGEIDGTLYLDMRLVDGENLRQVLLREGTLAPEQAVDIVEQVGAALDAAHAAGVVHRDVKPENVLVTPTGFAYLVDFGIAHDGTDSGLTKTGTAIGSTAYLAPEQLDGAPVSAASDVYSLSAVLFELLTGRPPFQGETVSAVIKATVLNQAPDVTALNPALPPTLNPVLARGLAKDPAQRFAAARDLGIAARQALSAQAPTSFTAIPPATPGSTQAFADQTMIADSGPQHFSGPQQYSVPQQQYSGPHYYTGPQQYTGPQYAQEKSGSALSVVLAGLIGLLVAALIGVGVYYFVVDGSDSSTAASPSTTTLTSTVQPEAQPEPGPVAPPPNSRRCSAQVGVGTDSTTCGFAENVYAAYLASGAPGSGRTVQASSPTTGLTYTMRCAPESGIVVCRGGNNAVVHIY